MPAVGVFTNWFKHNLYGGAYGGKQNYFVNLRNGLGQSTYDQIITYFLGQSSVYTDSMNLSEWHIYGSSRLGIYQTSINMAYRNIRIVNGVTTQETTTTVTLPSYTLFAVERGSKRYELTNHLGNVLAVVSDKKIQVCASTTISYYIADLVSATDYSPFGAPLAERTYTAPNISYRFAFNGQEKDDETYGEGNAYDFGARIYDSRLGRWMSIDPLKSSYPAHSGYSFGLDNPICFIDREGKYIVDKDDNIIKFKIKKNGEVKFKSSVDPFTKKYILSMVQTEASKEALIQLKDDKTIKVQVKSMSEKENDILRETQNGSFESLSGVTLSKKAYDNLNEYANGNIDQATYKKNERQINTEGLIRNGSMNPSIEKGRIEKIKDAEQYSQQVILINETPINKNANPDKEFLMTATEETVHSLQNYIEVIPGGNTSLADYLSLRHEKEAKEVAEKAGSQLETKQPKK